MSPPVPQVPLSADDERDPNHQDRKRARQPLATLNLQNLPPTTVQPTEAPKAEPQAHKFARYETATLRNATTAETDAVAPEDEAVQRWRAYLDGPTRDFSLARSLLTEAYPEEKLPMPQPNRNSNMNEVARYEAELKFFDCSDTESRRQVEELLARVVSQRYRRNRGQKRAIDPDSKFIDLKGIPARRLIAAERLFQRKLILLSGAGNIDVGLQVGGNVDGRCDKFHRNLGPAEKYRVYADAGKWCHDITCFHSQSKPLKENSYRIGHKYTDKVLSYRIKYPNTSGIITQLEDFLEQVLNNDNMSLVHVFKQMCLSHTVSNESIEQMHYENMDRKGWKWKIKDQFLRNCFHILSCEQSQWQSACFIEGDEWKLGMPVSFARLIKMFCDGHITLQDIFNKFPLYSNLSLLSKFQSLRKSCDEIDKLYQSNYEGLILDEDQALKDLIFLYGDKK